MKSNDFTVFIVDDDLEICQSFQWLFESVGFQVKTFDSAKSFLDNYDFQQVGCMIIDVRMPMMSGLELLEHLNLSKNNLSIIMITGYGDIQTAVRAMKAGATDFILKPVNEQQLLEILQKCFKKAESKESKAPIDILERMQTLSEREKQVMELVINGKLNKQIAYELEISISTVESHRARVMKKMGVKTLADLVKMSLQYQTMTTS